jgi:hypothetical protein
MQKIYSHYKIFGGFGLILALNGVIGFGTYMLLTASKVSVDKVDFINDGNARMAYLTIFGLELLFLILLMTQCRFIIADREGMVMINPLLPFLRKKWRWTDFDYYAIVDESSSHATHEAAWFVKNRKLVARFSSFYYTNFDDLLDCIATKSGRMDPNPFEQFFILLGLRKVGEP